MANARSHGFVLSKSSFCGARLKYLDLLDYPDEAVEKGTLRISYHIDTTKENIKELVNYLYDQLTCEKPQLEFRPSGISVLEVKKVVDGDAK